MQRVVGGADRNLRETLWGDIVLVSFFFSFCGCTFLTDGCQTGGNTLLPDFAERLQQDLKPLAPHDVKVGVSTVADARTAAWRGGLMLSNLSTFRDMCISYKEYDEYGPVLLRRRCLGICL